MDHLAMTLIIQFDDELLLLLGMIDYLMRQFIVASLIVIKHVEEAVR